MTDFTGFHFAEPRWLWLAAVAPVLLAGLHTHAARARRRQLARMASPRFTAELTASHSPARRRLKNALLLLAFALAGIALARPQWGRLEDSGNTWLGEDVVFALDCSRSMLATDAAPNRLQHAKFAIRDFVQRHGTGRVGLVAFAGSAFIQCPLTFDYDAFDETLMSLDDKTLPVPGTDIGRALIESYRAMDKGSHRKMILLVTDGEDLEKTGIAAARRLATNGVVVFTVGVGTAAGREIQFVNAAGQREILHDAHGQVVHSRLDETTLREIAAVTGGRYYPLGPTGEGLVRAGAAIQTLDRSVADHRARPDGVDRFYLPIAVALALITAESLIGTRRRKPAAA